MESGIGIDRFYPFINTFKDIFESHVERTSFNVTIISENQEGIQKEKQNHIKRGTYSSNNNTAK